MPRTDAAKIGFVVLMKQEREVSVVASLVKYSE